MTVPERAQMSLELIRRRIRKGQETNDPELRAAQFALAMVHFEALDLDLSTGGELPEDWKSRGEDG